VESTIHTILGTLNGPLFAIASPAMLASKLKFDHGNSPYTNAHQADIENFFTGFLRKAGFRRIEHTPYFALAADPSHSCHRSLASDDPSPPFAQANQSTAASDLEAFEAEIDEKRVKLVIFNEVGHRSDDCPGYPDAVVEKLIALHNITSPTQDQKMRFKYGCTCGKCIGGLLSPRMQLSV